MLERIIAKALRTPWAITPEYAAIVQDVLVARANGIRFTAAEIQARIDAVRATQPQTTLRAEFGDDPEDRDPLAYATIPMSAAAGGGSRGADGVIAIIPIHGVIANRSFEASSGATSAEFVSAIFQRADQDATVKAIIADFSSPGGAVEGVPEAAKVIRSSKKPKIAFIDALAASAAYWWASQFDEIIVRESGMVGSIGVYCLTEDWSEYLKKAGVKINAISAGDHKLDGAPWEPLSDEAKAALQREVDLTYQKFTAAVARGRGVSVATIRDEWQARVWNASDAVKMGLADAVGEFPVAIARANALSSGKSAARSGASIVAEHMGLDLAADADRTIVIPRATEPKADGDCPEGYEKDADGNCRPIEPSDDEKSKAQQAQADRDRLDLASA